MFEVFFGFAVMAALILLGILVAIGVIAIAGKWLWVALIAWIAWRFARARGWW